MTHVGAAHHVDDHFRDVGGVVPESLEVLGDEEEVVARKRDGAVTFP